MVLLQALPWIAAQALALSLRRGQPNRGPWPGLRLRRHRTGDGFHFSLLKARASKILARLDFFFDIEVHKARTSTAGTDRGWQGSSAGAGAAAARAYPTRWASVPVSAGQCRSVPVSAGQCRSVPVSGDQRRCRRQRGRALLASIPAGLRAAGGSSVKSRLEWSASRFDSPQPATR